LDDYEEGTWTPTIFGETTVGTTTYTAQNGSYTKIGRLVYVTYYVAWSAATGTGSMCLGNLPFTSGGSVSNLNSIAASATMMQDVAWQTGTSVTAYTYYASTYFFFYTSGNNIAWTSVQMDGSGGIIGSLTYLVSV
jgi:hypothetical protein